MIKVREAIIVEGKYDKINLSSFIDAVIIPTNGFRIFKDKEKINMLRKVSEKNGILILTDSDSAGFIIRNYIKNIVPKEQIKQAYIPDVYGKEKRKNQFSKEGKLGVEGINREIIIESIKRAGAIIENIDINISLNKQNKDKKISKMDFFEDGLSGGPTSKEKRKVLINHLDFPEYLSTNALLDVINSILSYDEYKSIIYNLFGR